MKTRSKRKKTQKRKIKSLYRVTHETAGGFVTSYTSSSPSKLKILGKNMYQRLKSGYSGTISKLNKKTNRYRKLKKINW